MSICCGAKLNKSVTKEFVKEHIRKCLNKLPDECNLEFIQEDDRGFAVGCRHCGFCDVFIADGGKEVHTSIYGAPRLGATIATICGHILVQRMGTGTYFCDTDWYSVDVFDGKEWRKEDTGLAEVEKAEHEKRILAEKSQPAEGVPAVPQQAKKETTTCRLCFPQNQDNKDGTTPLELPLNNTDRHL